MSTLGLETVEGGKRTLVQGRISAPGVEYYVPFPQADTPLEIKYLGPVGKGHLADLDLAKPVVPLVDQMRARYHEVARLIATGVDEVEVARRLDMSIEQVEMLTQVPSFRMVLQQHIESRNRAFDDLRRQINLVAEDSLAAIHQLIREKKLSHKELVRVTVELLNMDGYGAVQKHIVAHTSTDAIARAKRAALEANADRVLQILPGDSGATAGTGLFLPLS